MRGGALGRIAHHDPAAPRARTSSHKKHRSTPHARHYHRAGDAAPHSSAAAAAAAAATGSVKGKVYGGKIRTARLAGYPPGSVPPSTSGGAGEGEDSYKASVQRVALERFKAAMKE